jgi:osmoprotectant transport system ATP-binding protein
MDARPVVVVRGGRGTSDPLITLRDVSKRFGNAVALASTTLTLDAGRSLALVGSSGSGKSTLLRLVTGLELPDAGVITVAGETIAPDTLAAARARLGYVIQEGGLFPHLSCRTNVTLLAERRAMSAGDIKRRLDELTTLVRLSPELLDRFPHEVSGGQRQRVALMRALFRDPPVLLLDEPFGALDPIVRRDLGDELFALLRTLAKTVLLVTHDIAEAAALADEIAILRAGVVLQRGTLAKLRAQPAAPFVTELLSAHRNLASVVAP